MNYRNDNDEMSQPAFVFVAELHRGPSGAHLIFRKPEFGICDTHRSYNMYRRSKYNVYQDFLRRMSTSTGKEKVVILGIGWGGYRLARDLDKVIRCHFCILVMYVYKVYTLKKKFDVTVVSPRNHFLFTPLLPSTSVGTLEFRYAQCTP